jgi:hypothetical protein
LETVGSFAGREAHSKVGDVIQETKVGNLRTRGSFLLQLLTVDAKVEFLFANFQDQVSESISKLSWDDRPRIVEVTREEINMRWVMRTDGANVAVEAMSDGVYDKIGNPLEVSWMKTASKSGNSVSP